jgi:hypothetical protein
MLSNPAKYLLTLVNENPGRYKTEELIDEIRQLPIQMGVEDPGRRTAARFFDEMMKTGKVTVAAGKRCYPV